MACPDAVSSTTVARRSVVDRRLLTRPRDSSRCTADVIAFDPDKLAAASDNLDEFDRIHSAQPGFIGSVVVELGSSRRFVLNLWQSAKHSDAALTILGPEVNRLLGPLMLGPSEFIGAGPVISTDLMPSASS
jgi:hypothetical protein